MRFFTKKGVIRKIAIVILIVLAFNFCMPKASYAWDPWNWLMDSGKNLANTLTRDILQFFAAIGDLFMGALNYFMLGADFDSAMVSWEDANLTDENSWLHVNDGEITEENLVDISSSKMDSKLFGLVEVGLAVPNFLYSPEAIFSNRIAALDVNFLNPEGYTYSSVVAGVNNAGEDGESDVQKRASKKAESGAIQLKETIATWYRTFRNLAVVILLIVLIYIGIRIVLSSSAGEKAKYKEGIKDWMVAMSLVFFIHILMAGILLMTEKFTQLFSSISTNDIIVHVSTSGNGDEEAEEGEGEQPAAEETQQTSSLNHTETVVNERASIQQASALEASGDITGTDTNARGLSIAYTEGKIKEELDKYKNGDKSLIQDPTFNEDIIREWKNTLNKNEEKNKEYLDLIDLARQEKNGPLTPEQVSQVSNPQNQDPTQPQQQSSTSNSQQTITSPSSSGTSQNAEQPVAAAEGGDEGGNSVTDVVKDDFSFHTNLIGLARFRTQSTDWLEAGAYTVIYAVLIVYTYVFTFKYFARFLKMAFLTMIAPLVAITYPIDKMGDSQAQAFNMWFKEYLMNVIIQPVHLLLYTALIGSAFDLATSNLLYAIAAVAFLVPAENFIKEMFNIRPKPDKDYGLGMLSAGVLGKTALDAITKTGKGITGGIRGAAGAVGGALGVGGGEDGLPPKSPFDAKEALGLGGEGGPETDDSGNPLIDGAADVAGGIMDGAAEGASTGASVGGTLGSIIPGVGTAVGSAIGAAVGGVTGAGVGTVGGVGGALVDGAAEMEEQLDEGAPPEEINVQNTPGLDTNTSSEEQYLSGGTGTPQINQSQESAPRLAVNASSNSGKPKLKNGWAKSVGKRVFKTAGKIASFGAKAGMGVIGSGFGAALGVGLSGITGMNPLQAALVGAGTGGFLGAKVGGIPEGLVKSAPKAYNRLTAWKRDRQYNMNKDLYGLEYAQKVRKQQDDAAAFKAFSKNDVQKERADKILAGIQKQNPNSKLTQNDVLKSTYEYAKYGVNNETAANMIQREVELTGGLGNDQLTHGRLLTAAVKNEGLKSEFFLDPKKVANYNKSMALELGGIENANAIMYEMAREKGHGALELERQGRANQQQAIAEQQNYQLFANDEGNIKRAKGIHDKARTKDRRSQTSQEQIMKALYDFSRRGSNNAYADKAVEDLASRPGVIDTRSQEYNDMRSAAAIMSSGAVTDDVFTDDTVNAQVYTDLSAMVGTERAGKTMENMAKLKGEDEYKKEMYRNQKTDRNKLTEELLEKNKGKGKPGTGSSTTVTTKAGAPQLGTGKPGKGKSGTTKQGTSKSETTKPVSNKPANASKSQEKQQKPKKLTKKQQKDLEKKLAKQFEKEQKKRSPKKRRQISGAFKQDKKNKKLKSSNIELTETQKAQYQSVDNLKKAYRSGNAEKLIDAKDDYKSMRMVDPKGMDNLKKNGNL